MYAQRVSFGHVWEANGFDSYIHMCTFVYMYNVYVHVCTYIHVFISRVSCLEMFEEGDGSDPVQVVSTNIFRAQARHLHPYFSVFVPIDSWVSDETRDIQPTARAKYPPALA